MAQKLTIVVTCTDRKSAQPEPDLMVRNLPAASIAERVDLWKTRLASATDRVPLRQLYHGESWTQVTQTRSIGRSSWVRPDSDRRVGRPGPVEADAPSPAYAATFSPRQADSVGATRSKPGLGGGHSASRSTSARDHLNDPTLLVLSKSLRRRHGIGISASLPGETTSSSSADQTPFRLNCEWPRTGG